MERIELNVEGMHCKSCETLIKEDLEEIDNIQNVKADNSTGKVSIEYDGTLPMDRIKDVIKELGFSVKQ